MAEGLYFPAPEGGGDEISIYSSIDAQIVGPLVAGFQSIHPDIAVRYDDLLTGEVAARVISETDHGSETADLAISSAMDLQVKLANDGYALPLALDLPDNLPPWAAWRDTAFALTLEPAVIAYHRPSFPDGPPESRAALLDWVHAQGQGRIGSYDITRAGVGFLFLMRDQEHFADIWRLVAAMGEAGLVTYPTSREVIEAVATGELALGYNILGSYALGRAESLPDLGIALPRDFIVAVSRVAIVPRAARNPAGGAAFLQYLLSPAGQAVMAAHLHLPPLVPDGAGDTPAARLILEAGERLRPVPVSPGLLAYNDQSRRNRFLSLWYNALE